MLKGLACMDQHKALSALEMELAVARDQYKALSAPEMEVVVARHEGFIGNYSSKTNESRFGYLQFVHTYLAKYRYKVNLNCDDILDLCGKGRATGEGAENAADFGEVVSNEGDNVNESRVGLKKLMICYLVMILFPLIHLQLNKKEFILLLHLLCHPQRQRKEANMHFLQQCLRWLFLSKSTCA